MLLVDERPPNGLRASRTLRVSVSVAPLKGAAPLKEARQFLQRREPPQRTASPRPSGTRSCVDAKRLLVIVKQATAVVPLQGSKLHGGNPHRHVGRSPSRRVDNTVSAPTNFSPSTSSRFPSPTGQKPTPPARLTAVAYHVSVSPRPPCYTCSLLINGNISLFILSIEITHNLPFRDLCSIFITNFLQRIISISVQQSLFKLISLISGI